MPNNILLGTTEKMNKAVERLIAEFSTINTGRANPAVLNRVMVDYYGAPTPLNQIAQVGAQDAQTLQITPYDKSAIAAIDTAIQQANLGFNPANDGNVIRISIPPLTKERRQDLAKQIKSFGEDAKVAIRNIRRDSNDALKKLELSEDDSKGYQSDVQTETDKFIKKIDELVVAKEKDVTTL